jgi:glycosyltransferase 2 family protein
VSAKRWLLVALSFAAAIGVSVYVVVTTWPETEQQALLEPPVHLVLLGFVALELVARGFKFKLNAMALRIPLHIRAGIRTSLGGDFGSAVTPSRTGAEPARFLILAEAGVPKGGILMLLFGEVFLEMMSLAVIVLALLMIFQASDGAFIGVLALAIGYALLVSTIGVIGVYLSRRPVRGKAPKLLRRVGMHGGHWRAVQRALRQLRLHIGQVRHARWGLLVLALIASVIHILCRLAVLPVLAYSLGSDATLGPLILWPLVMFYGGILIPAPAGGGLIEVVFAAALGGTLEGGELGASLIWWRFYTFYIYVLLGGLVAGATVKRLLARGAQAKVMEEMLREDEAALDAEARLNAPGGAAQGS